MRYQAKPTVPRTFEALEIESGMTKYDIVHFIIKYNSFDLLKHFNLRDDELYLGTHKVEVGQYLIRENNSYRLLDKEIFEDMYIPVQE